MVKTEAGVAAALKNNCSNSPMLQLLLASSLVSRSNLPRVASSTGVLSEPLVGAHPANLLRLAAGNDDPTWANKHHVNISVTPALVGVANPIADYGLADFGNPPYGPVGLQDVAPQFVPTNELGCAPFQNDAPDRTSLVAGKIALMKRGNCSFYDKVLNAQRGGAVAVIIVNGRFDPLPFSMTTVGAGASAGEVTIPSVIISYSVGAELIAATDPHQPPHAISMRWSLGSGGDVKLWTWSSDAATTSLKEQLDGSVLHQLYKQGQDSLEVHYVIFSCATPNSDVCGDQCLAGSHGRYCGLKTCLAGSSGWVDPKSGVAAPCVSGDKVVMEDLRQMCILNTTAGASVRGSNNEPFANPFYLYYLKRFNENCYNASSRGFGPSGEMNFVPNETCFSDQFVAATANAYARSVGGAAKSLDYYGPVYLCLDASVGGDRDLSSFNPAGTVPLMEVELAEQLGDGIWKAPTLQINGEHYEGSLGSIGPIAAAVCALQDEATRQSTACAGVPTPAPAPDSGPSSGVAAGTVVGALLGVSAFFAGGFFFYKRSATLQASTDSRRQQLGDWMARQSGGASGPSRVLATPSSGAATAMNPISGRAGTSVKYAATPEEHFDYNEL